MYFNIFGSGDSLDCDVMVFVDQLPETIEECKQLCLKNDVELREILGTDKDINSNLAVVRMGMIVDCFKGISIETNNSVFITYEEHEQMQPCYVTQMMPVTFEWALQKSARALRIMLSFISRTQYRKEVKAALKGTTRQKMATLLSIDLSTIEDFGKNNLTKADVYKNIAFQSAQATGLISDFYCGGAIELYTKEAIAEYEPCIKPYLYREDVNAIDLNTYKDIFIGTLIDSLHCDPKNRYNLEHIKE